MQKKEQDNNLASFQTFVNRLVSFCAAVVIFAIVVFIFSFSKDGQYTQESFGQFGDFLGGMLNPLLGFSTILLLAYSIRIQIQELKTANKELELSRDEMKIANAEAARSARAMQAQMEHIQRQDKVAQAYQTYDFYDGKIRDLLSKQFYLESDVLKKVKQHWSKGTFPYSSAGATVSFKHVYNKTDSCQSVGASEFFSKAIRYKANSLGYAPLLDLQKELLTSLGRKCDSICMLIEHGVIYEQCEIRVQDLFMQLNELTQSDLVESPEVSKFFKAIDGAITVRQKSEPSFNQIGNKYRYS